MSSLYVQKRPNSWRLMREEWINKKRTQRAVPKTAWTALGFSDAMTLDQARARVKQLNQAGSIEREQQRAVTAIAARVERDRLHHSTFIPEDLNQAFLKFLEDNVSGSLRHLDKVKMTWATAKKLIIKLQLLPEHFEGAKKQIYKYLASQEYSMDYSKKIIRTMNLYGKWAAKLTGRFYEPVPGPRGHDREMINDAYLDSDSYFGPSEPLTPDGLALLKNHLKPEQHDWLTLSVWFGLRPSEIDLIIGDRSQKFWRVDPGATDVLWAYQPKLTSKPRALRWKPIPLIFPEQMEAIKIVYAGLASAPLTKTIKRHLGTHTTLYGGRKGFTDLMLDKGQKLEDIAAWLGHSSIEMTWTRYKDKRRVHFTKAT